MQTSCRYCRYLKGHQMTLKQFEALIKARQERTNRITTMKKRIVEADAAKHRETCIGCRAMWDALHEVKAFHSAGEQTKSILDKIRGESL